MDMFVKFNSTGKSKSKQMQPIRMTECSTCPRLMQNSANKRNYERPQPLKIAQLLRETENSKKISKDSIRKKILPERLGQLSSKKSIKKQGIGTNNETLCFNKCVRRNLNFNEIPVNTSKNNNESKNKLNNFTIDKIIPKNASESIKRKSFLLPPNTIKHKYLQKCTKEQSNCSKIPQSEEIVSIDENCGAYICSTIEKESTETKIINISLLNNELSQKGNNSGQSEYMKASNESKTVAICNDPNSHITNINYPQSFNIPDDIIKSSVVFEYTASPDANYTQNKLSLKETFIPDKTNIESEISSKLRNEGKCIQNLYNDLQDTRLIESENNTNVRCTPSKAIYVDRDKIIRLECDLKNLLSETEKNVSKIKSTLTYLTRLLCVNNEEITEETEYSVSGKVYKTVVDKGIQVETCKLIQQTEDNLNALTLHDHIPQIITTDIKYVNTIQNDEDNKENHESTSAKHISEVKDSVTHDCYIQKKTPIIIKYRQKRSLCEYMALKSTMSFLETPDGKKFRSLCQNEDINTSAVNKTYISNKVLADLHDLYSESPEFC